MADNWVIGWCVGGPLDGRQVTVRSAPFMAADKVAGKAWIYQQAADGTFEVRTDHDDSLIYPDGPRTGERGFDEQRAWDAGAATKMPIIAVDSAR